MHDTSRGTEEKKQKGFTGTDKVAWRASSHGMHLSRELASRFENKGRTVRHNGKEDNQLSEEMTANERSRPSQESENRKAC